VVIGEGGSGGALGIGSGDRVAMFEHSFYSVISPEGCAAILWRTGEQAKQAAEALKITSRELKKLGLVDDVLPEPLGGAHRDPAKAAATLERYLGKTIRELKALPVKTLLKKRHERLRSLGSFFVPLGETTKKSAEPGAKSSAPARAAVSGATRSTSRAKRTV
jgi:acetyl-CoA carboxylase carboxyl transferase subunit alpha